MASEQQTLAAVRRAWARSGGTCEGRQCENRTTTARSFEGQWVVLCDPCHDRLTKGTMVPKASTRRSVSNGLSGGRQLRGLGRLCDSGPIWGKCPRQAVMTVPLDGKEVALCGPCEERILGR